MIYLRRARGANSTVAARFNLQKNGCIILLAILFLSLMGCDYHSVREAESNTTISTLQVPYIKGDNEGKLNGALSEALYQTGVFQYTASGGDWVLEAAIIADGDDRIGFRYDRDPTNGTLRDNIVGTENRRAIAVEFKVTQAHTDQVILGPETVRAIADYDYVDGNSIQDLTFFNRGSAQTVLDFSMGQLDSLQGAHDDTDDLIYTRMAQKIVTQLMLKYLEKQ